MVINNKAPGIKSSPNPMYMPVRSFVEQITTSSPAVANIKIINTAHTRNAF